MDEAHLAAAVRYVLLNPVRAGFVKRAQEWRWSSIHAHLSSIDDAVTTTEPLATRLGDLACLLEATDDDLEALDARRRAVTIGRPVGEVAFLAPVNR